MWKNIKHTHTHAHTERQIERDTVWYVLIMYVVFIIALLIYCVLCIQRVCVICVRVPALSSISSSTDEKKSVLHIQMRSKRMRTHIFMFHVSHYLRSDHTNFSCYIQSNARKRPKHKQTNGRLKENFDRIKIDVRKDDPSI